ncbi:MAG: beta-ketoacyl-[acyl-carrier-protein] synthase family protein [Polyangiaceae bacterium]
MRTWIVGLGLISPLSATARGTMRALLAGERAQSKVTLFDVSELRAQLAAEVKDLRVEDLAPPGAAARWSRSDALALIAARDALAEGRVTRDMPVDLISGGTTGGLFMTEAKLAALHGPLKQGGDIAERALAEAAADESLRSHPVSATADRLFEAAHPFRRSRTLCSACSSSANAIALADAWIRSGRSKLVLAGGTDALARLTFVGFNLLQAMDPAPCRPFDGKRMGMNIGEAAAFLLLESDESARARGVTPIAELSGWAIGSEAHHITNPEATGSTAARLMRTACARAGLRLDDIGYVNAHGTATPHNDRMEGAALADVFGERLRDLHVSSTKGQLGHTLGAAGAVEAAITALALQGHELPPTAGLEEPDPAIPAMHHVREKGTSHRARAALSSSFGFGGSNTVLALTEPELFAPPAASASRRIYIASSAILGPEGIDEGDAAARYLQGSPGENIGATAAESLAKSLAPDRARRLDRGAALVTAIHSRALAAAGVDLTADTTRLGMVCGIAFRKEEDFAAFLSPILEKGFRAGKPAVFPNLLLSSPAGHASIYLGVKGAVFTTNDVTLTMGTAFASAADLLLAGEADAVVASTVVERDTIVERVVGPRTYGPNLAAPPHSPAAAALLLRTGDSTEHALCTLEDWQDGTRLSTWSPPPPPAEGAVVVLPRPSEPLTRALDASSWSAAPRIVVSARAGSHEGTLGLALAAAAAALHRGEARTALVMDHWHEPGTLDAPSPGRWAAFTLASL